MFNPRKGHYKALSIANRLKHVRAGKGNQVHIEATRFALAVLTSCSNFTQTRRLFLRCGLDTIAESTFYKKQKTICPVLEDLARERVNRNLQQLLPDTCISFDGSWSHRRQANFCFVSMIDTRSQRIIDFEFATRSHQQANGNYEGSSQGMEIACLRMIVRRLKTDARITSFVHDNDGKARALMREEGWEIAENLDLNHITKSLTRLFESCCFSSPMQKTEYAGMLPSPDSAIVQVARATGTQPLFLADGSKKTTRTYRRNLLKELQERLYRFFKVLLYSDRPVEERVHLWLNAARHYVGDHRQCQHPPNSTPYIWKHARKQENVDALIRFLDASSPLFSKCQTEFSTQMNESLNSVKVHFAGKDYAWVNSWRGRVCCAILQVEDPEGWRWEAEARLGLSSLPLSISRKIRQLERKEAFGRWARHSPELRAKHRGYKMDRRSAGKVKPTERVLYRTKGDARIEETPDILN